MSELNDYRMIRDCDTALHNLAKAIRFFRQIPVNKRPSNFQTILKNLIKLKEDLEQID